MWSAQIGSLHADHVTNCHINVLLLHFNYLCKPRVFGPFCFPLEIHMDLVFSLTLLNKVCLCKPVDMQIKKDLNYNEN